jgi:hypothetical protein
MCRESIKGYLKTQILKSPPAPLSKGGETEEAIALLVDEQNSEKIDHPEAVLEALKKVRTCDLACGSGAYLLGMLHELLDLRQCLESSIIPPLSRGARGDSVYQHKLDIIQNNLYGVDIDIFAVNIARLRLWLSLAVDYEGKKPKPLPNLKYKIQVGDSLISPNPTEFKLTDILIGKYREVKAEYIKTHDGNKKKDLEKDITKLKKEISLITYGNDSVDKFDWSLDFAEVFADGGFDIVVANPPYVRQELIKDLKPTLKKVYPEIYTGRADLYCFFYARALQLLNTSQDFYLLGVINSSCVEKFYAELSTQILGGNLRFFRQYVEQIPIPPASDSEKEAISKLVQKCLDAKGVNCEAWEKEIDDRVAALYGL